MTIQKLSVNLQKVFMALVLLSAISLFAISANAGHHGEKMHNTIVDVAAGNGSFNTLVAALEAADLVETLKGEGPFTVFAPTDEAFAKLPAGTVESLLLPENKDKLTAILTYHVVAGKVTSDQVVKLEAATTVNGQDVKIRTANNVVMINDATVAAADVGASNGVIHVIDEVILPN
jgi:uncharacterized surface protein with fasciclin (FAS1) repeats